MHYYISAQQTLRNLRMDMLRYQIGSPLQFPAKAVHNSGLIFSFLYRIEHYLVCSKHLHCRLLGKILYPLYFLITYYILDYHIEPNVTIEGGLFLHNRSIVIADKAVIGKNVSIMGQVTIGTGFITNPYTITIGDNVKIGVGAKIIANDKLNITDDVIIGANAVVTKSIRRSGTYVGIPAKKLVSFH